MTARQRLVRGVLWAGVILGAVVFECSLVFAVTTRNQGPYYYTSAPDINWGVLKGRYALAIPHEVSGRYPYRAWLDLFDNSLLGFNLKIASSGLPQTYTRVTMVTIPCWFVALIGGCMTYWSARRLGMRLVWRRRGRRGFQVISPAEVTPPLPAVRTEG